MTDIIKNYLFVNVICDSALVVLAYVSWNNVLLIPKMKKYFFAAVLAVMVVIGAEMACVIFENIRIMDRVHAIVANSIGFSLSPFIAIILSEAFLVEKGKIRSFLTIPAWVNLIFVISSPWTGLVFRIYMDNNYLRGPYFGVYIFAYLYSYVILIMDAFKSMERYQCYSKCGFFILLVFTITGTSIQLVFPKVHVSWMCVTLYLILFYAYYCTLTQTQDTLTDLLNRNVYDYYIKGLDHDVNGIIIVFDIDNFKRINDIYGHHWGDCCLQIIGKHIKDCFQKMGFCYRIGGDEFCVICRTTDENKVKDAISRFHCMLNETKNEKNLLGEFPMVSSGYELFHGSGMLFDEASKKADEHMYIFKNNRKKSTS